VLFCEVFNLFIFQPSWSPYPPNYNQYSQLLQVIYHGKLSAIIRPYPLQYEDHSPTNCGVQRLPRRYGFFPKKP
jgi:hypothetical protein